MIPPEDHASRSSPQHPYLAACSGRAVWETDFGMAHSLCMARSHRHFTGRDLSPGITNPAELAKALFYAPYVLVSHGTEDDPILNYGNAAALALWDMTWMEFTRTPSRYTAEAPNREERARLLAEVTSRGFIDDYSGIRISRAARRFRISRATVWNLLTEDGRRCGQAATFGTWEWL